MLTTSLSRLITDVLEEIGAERLQPVIEFVDEVKFGDLTTNVAMVACSQSKDLAARFSGSKGLAQALVEGLETKLTSEENSGVRKNITKIEVADPGFVNFTVSDYFLCTNLDLVLSEKGSYGKVLSDTRRKTVVEYSSPNIAKPFTIGHLRSTVIGDAVANILEFNGYQVFRDNHLGDWGTQFGKLIVALRKLGQGSLENNLAKINLAENPVKELVALYIEFHKLADSDPSLEDEGREWFTRLEKGDEQARELWQKCIEWSWVEFSRIYEQLGVKFTENEGKGYGESYFEDKMGEVLEELKAKNLLVDGKDGAQLVFFEGNKLPPLMILKKDGSTLYATRDLATDKFRLEKYGSDIWVINEVGAEQELYFRQLYELERMLGWYKSDQRVHIKHGHFRFKEGKMSTRKGNVIWLEDVLDEAIKKARQVMEEVDKGSELTEDEKQSLSEVVGIGALKWNDLKGSTQREILFDWNEMLNMQGNSGPYVQYTYARAKSVLVKAEVSRLSELQYSEKVDLMEIVLNEEERAVLVWLWRFRTSVERAATELAPHLIAGYIYELAQRFNTFYNKHSILKVEPSERRAEVLRFRIALTSGVAEVLKTGLGLLGIEAPERM